MICTLNGSFVKMQYLEICTLVVFTVHNFCSNTLPLSQTNFYSILRMIMTAIYIVVCCGIIVYICWCWYCYIPSIWYIIFLWEMFRSKNIRLLKNILFQRLNYWIVNSFPLLKYFLQIISHHFDKLKLLRLVDLFTLCFRNNIS